jgi:hypothetical protein
MEALTQRGGGGGRDSLLFARAVDEVGEGEEADDALSEYIEGSSGPRRRTKSARLTTFLPPLPKETDLKRQDPPKRAESGEAGSHPADS